MEERRKRGKSIKILVCFFFAVTLCSTSVLAQDYSSDELTEAVGSLGGPKGISYNMMWEDTPVVIEVMGVTESAKIPRLVEMIGDQVVLQEFEWYAFQNLLNTNLEVKLERTPEGGIEKIPRVQLPESVSIWYYQYLTMLGMASAEGDREAMEIMRAPLLVPQRWTLLKYHATEKFIMITLYDPDGADPDGFVESIFYSRSDVKQIFDSYYLGYLLAKAGENLLSQGEFEAAKDAYLSALVIRPKNETILEALHKARVQHK